MRAASKRRMFVYEYVSSYGFARLMIYLQRWWFKIFMRMIPII